jgi:hypothetical protein
MPPGNDPWLRELAMLFNEEVGRREPTAIGWRHDGTLWHLRFRAPLNSLWVQVHVQGSGSGGGGIVAYDPDNFVSSTEVDCRENRLQDVEIPDGRHLVFLIPVNYDGAGTKVVFDGEDGRQDFATFVDLGTAVLEEVASEQDELWSLIHLGYGGVALGDDEILDADKAMMVGAYAGHDYSEA